MAREVGRPVDHAKDRAILRAARDLLYDQGPQGLTMEAVAERAKVSKVTVYARYPNRVRLLQAVVEGEAFVITQPIERMPETREALRRDLCAFAEGMVSFVNGRRHRRLMLALAAVPQKGADLAHVYRNGPEKAHQMITDYLKAAAARGLIRCSKPRESAELLFGMVTGLDILRGPYRMRSERRTAQSRAQHVRRCVDAFMALYAIAEK